MAQLKEAVDLVFKQEGYDTITNDPNDRGGLTRYGISQHFHPEVDVARLDRRGAERIYHDEYWAPLALDRFRQPTANCIFSMAVHFGTSRAALFAQRAANICKGVPDGIREDCKLGPKSEEAINGVPETHFLRAFLAVVLHAYVDRIRADVSQYEYIRGWINRAMEATLNGGTKVV